MRNFTFLGIAALMLAIIFGFTACVEPPPDDGGGGGGGAGGGGVVTVIPTGTPKTFGGSGTAFEMVWINAGTFLMGSPPEEPGRYPDEPQHPVTLTKGFYMGKYPVTQEQYEAVMLSNPSIHKVYGERGYYLNGIVNTANFPVEKVSWYDAIVFCNKLSILEGLSPAYRISGRTYPADWGEVPTSSDETWDSVEIVAGSTGYRLPTEAQWEYACRAGTTTAFNWGTDYINSTQANYRASTIDPNNTAVGTYLGRTTYVRSYESNAWGLYDMHGNVFQWCWDWYAWDESGEGQIDPEGAVSGEGRVYKGGSWGVTGRYARSSSCLANDPGDRDYTVDSVGIRLIRP